ncbi:MAG: hypothetical protein V1765_00475 [bacterium]
MGEKETKEFVVLCFRKCLPAMIGHTFKWNAINLSNKVSAYVQKRKRDFHLCKPIICSNIKTEYCNEKGSEYLEKIAFYCDDFPGLEKTYKEEWDIRGIRNKAGQIRLNSLKKVADKSGYVIKEEIIWV